MTHVCRKCGDELVVGENITQYGIDDSCYICRNCRRDYKQEYQHKNPGHLRDQTREWLHRTGRNKPMNENKNCAAYLGVHIAEQVLSIAFKNVKVMPYGNPGFDFICGGGYMIDVKSSCRHHHENRADYWLFTINKNRIADYFLCLAFDNRESLNPEHLWLIPAGNINNRMGVSISETVLDRWAEYALDIDQISACCNTMRAG